MATKIKIDTKAAAAAAASKVTYKDMIKSAVVTLKERNGSSRQALKKYVQSNYDVKTASFDSLFNAALRKGVETGDFLQPKGPSGPVKVAKKEKTIAPSKVTKKTAEKAPIASLPKKAVAKKAVPKTVAKKVVPKKAVPKAVAKKAAPKKAAPKKAAPKKVVKKTAAKVTKPVAKKVIKKTAPKTAPKSVTKKPASTSRSRGSKK